LDEQDEEIRQERPSLLLEEELQQDSRSDLHDHHLIVVHNHHDLDAHTAEEVKGDINKKPRDISGLFISLLLRYSLESLMED